MEPNSNSQNSPERKIVFTAPGMQMGPTSAAPAHPVVPQNAQNNMQTNPEPAAEAKQEIKPEIKPLHPKPIVTNFMPMPGGPKITPHIEQPGQSANPAFRSFAHDIKSNVEDKGVSMAQIVMEQERKKREAGATAEDIQAVDKKSQILKAVLILVSIIAIVGGGIVLFITLRARMPVEQIVTPEDYSPIRAQKVAAIDLRDGFKNTLLEAIRGVTATRVPEETFVELRLFETVATTSVPVTFGKLMQILDSRIPDDLLRATGDNYIIGVYGKADTSAPFLMMSVDLFENGYVGMTAWERTILGDIGGIFIDQDELSVIIASSTPSLFVDKVYYNKDTRAVFGTDGKPLLVWAIVDRKQVIITTDGETLNALMKRITLENIRR